MKLTNFLRSVLLAVKSSIAVSHLSLLNFEIIDQFITILRLLSTQKLDFHSVAKNKVILFDSRSQTTAQRYT